MSSVFAPVSRFYAETPLARESMGAQGLGARARARCLMVSAEMLRLRSTFEERITVQEVAYMSSIRKTAAQAHEKGLAAVFYNGASMTMAPALIAQLVRAFG